MDLLSEVDNHGILVVYLSWLPYGIGNLESFIDSYNSNSAGARHKLLILFNGTEFSNELVKFKDLVRNQLPDAEIMELNRGFDIEAYFICAQNRSEELILFCNTFTRFTSNYWLLYYIRAFKENVGVVGATASNQSLLSTVFMYNKWTWEFNKGINYNFRKIRLLVKANVWWRFLIHGFPNPHIRTTAFMVRRKVFISLSHPVLKRKFDAYLFESGKRSMTNQLLEKGLRPVVIGKTGESYTIDNWKESNVFWKGDQENLLIRDNQTDLYDQADEKYKKYLTRISWGNDV